MSFTVDEFSQHSIHAGLKALGDTIKETTAATRERKNEPHLDYLSRFESIRRFAAQRLKSADPALVARPTLDSLASLAQNANNELAAYQSTGNDGNFGNAINHFNSLIQTANQIPFPASLKEAEALAETLKAARLSVRGHLGSVAKQIHSC